MSAEEGLALCREPGWHLMNSSFCLVMTGVREMLTPVTNALAGAGDCLSRKDWLAAQLVEGNGRCSGRVEVYFEGVGVHGVCLPVGGELRAGGVPALGCGAAISAPEGPASAGAPAPFVWTRCGVLGWSGPWRSAPTPAGSSTTVCTGKTPASSAPVNVSLFPES